MTHPEFTLSQTPRIHTWSMKPPRGCGAGLDEPTLDQLPRPRRERQSCAKVSEPVPVYDAVDVDLAFDIDIDIGARPAVDDGFFFSEPPRPVRRRSSSGAGVVFAVTLVVTGAVAGFAGTRAHQGHGLELPSLSDLGLR